MRNWIFLTALIFLLITNASFCQASTQVTRVPSACADSDADCTNSKINADDGTYEEVNLKTSPYGWLNVTDWNTDIPTVGTSIVNATLYVNWTNSSTTQTGNVYVEYTNGSGWGACAGPVDGCHQAECQSSCNISALSISLLNSVVARFRGEDLDRLLPALGKIDYIYIIAYYQDNPPNWRLQQTNDTDNKITATINLSAEGYDGIGLSYAWLETNESGGTWVNYTSSYSGNYGSPMNLGDVVAVWTQSNFTWHNTSVTDASVGWRIWYNDTSGGVNSTNLGVFMKDVVTPSFTNVTSNATSASVGETVRFTGYWQETTTARFVVDDDSSFTNCNYDTTTGCMCSSGTVPGGSGYNTSTCDYTVQSGDGGTTITWYARVCDSLNNCDKNITKTYDFTDSTNNTAYEKGPDYPTSPTDYNSTATSDDYANLSLEDNDWWNTTLASASGDNDTQIYVFNVTELYDQIFNLTAVWEGYGETASGYYTNLSLWNWSSSSWYELDNNDFTSEADGNLTGAVTTNLANFVNTSTGQVAALATTLKGGATCEEACQTDCSTSWIFDGCWDGSGSPPAGCYTTVTSGSECAPDHCVCFPSFCPFLYSWNGSDYVMDTVFLYKIDGKEKKTIQERTLSNISASGQMKAIIRELEPEISFIDFVSLKITDSSKGKDEITILKPISASRDLKKMLDIDNDYMITKQGDEVYLEFDSAPPLKDGYERKIQVVASGYYELYNNSKILTNDVIFQMFLDGFESSDYYNFFLPRSIDMEKETINGTNKIEKTLHTDYVELLIASNASGNITVAAAANGNLTVVLDYPTSHLDVVQNDTFWVNTTVTCVDANCGEVYGVLRYNNSGAEPDTNVSTTAGMTPLWTSSTNAQSCGSMNQNDICMKNWSVNASGWFLKDYALDVNFSTTALYNDTSNAEMTIINSYQVYYGNVTGNISLSDRGGNRMTLFSLQQASGVVFVSDSDSLISWSELVEIGKNTAGGNSTNDFTEIDTVLNMTNKPDNLNSSYSTSGSKSIYTDSFIVFNNTLSYVPLASNYGNSSFKTGILWDSSDDIGDDGEFDSSDKEDLVFVVELNETGSCYAGNCDYEIKIPYSLKSYKSGTDTVSFYVMYL